MGVACGRGMIVIRGGGLVVAYFLKDHLSSICAGIMWVALVWQLWQKYFPT